MIDSATDLAAEHLEDLLNDECKCQATYHYGKTCRVHVVALLCFKCEPERPMLVCQAIVTEYWESCKEEDWCGDCGQLISECWSIRPV